MPCPASLQIQIMLLCSPRSGAGTTCAQPSSRALGALCCGFASESSFCTVLVNTCPQPPWLHTKQDVYSLSGTLLLLHRSDVPNPYKWNPRLDDLMTGSIFAVCMQARRLFWWFMVPLVTFLLCLWLRQHSEHLVQQTGWANSPMLARLRSRTPSMEAWTSWGSDKAHDLLPEWALHKRPRTPLQVSLNHLFDLRCDKGAVVSTIMAATILARSHDGLLRKEADLWPCAALIYFDIPAAM